MSLLNDGSETLCFDSECTPLHARPYDVLPVLSDVFSSTAFHRVVFDPGDAQFAPIVVFALEVYGAFATFYLTRPSLTLLRLLGFPARDALFLFSVYSSAFPKSPLPPGPRQTFFGSHVLSDSR